MIERLLSRSRALSRALVWLGGALIVGSALLVTVEVFLRKFAGVSISGADELSGYAFGVAVALGLAFALFERAHIRVDALYRVFPSWLRLTVDLLGLALTHNSRSITPLRLPLAIPQLPWLFGWLFFVFCGALMLTAAALRLLRRDRDAVDALIAPPQIAGDRPVELQEHRDRHGDRDHHRHRHHHRDHHGDRHANRGEHDAD